MFRSHSTIYFDAKQNHIFRCHVQKQTNGETLPIILNISQLILKYLIFLSSQMKVQQTLMTKFFYQALDKLHTIWQSICFLVKFLHLTDSSFGVLSHVIDTCFHLPNRHDVIFVYLIYFLLRIYNMYILKCIYGSLNIKKCIYGSLPKSTCI